jgi:hypothetical protein
MASSMSGCRAHMSRHLMWAQHGFRDAGSGTATVGYGPLATGVGKAGLTRFGRRRRFMSSRPTSSTSLTLTAIKAAAGDLASTATGH